MARFLQHSESTAKLPDRHGSSGAESPGSEGTAKDDVYATVDE
jgi:hypothetical protein